MAEHTRMPALTAAEADVIDHFLAVVDCLAHINPARTDHTYSALRAAQALAAHAVGLRDALTLMFERGEDSIHTTILRRALQLLDAERRIARITIPEPQ